MAGNKTKITDIVGKEAFDQLERLDRKLADTQNVYIGLVKEIGKGLTINPSSLSELNAKIEEYKKKMYQRLKARLTLSIRPMTSTRERLMS